MPKNFVKNAVAQGHACFKDIFQLFQRTANDLNVIIFSLDAKIVLKIETQGSRGLCFMLSDVAGCGIG
jgi:hypothetical protein